MVRKSGKPIKESTYGYSDEATYICPSCGSILCNGKNCEACGKEIDWSDLKERDES